MATSVTSARDLRFVLYFINSIALKKKAGRKLVRIFGESSSSLLLNSPNAILILISGPHAGTRENRR